MEMNAAALAVNAQPAIVWNATLVWNRLAKGAADARERESRILYRSAKRPDDISMKQVGKLCLDSSKEAMEILSSLKPVWFALGLRISNRGRADEVDYHFPRDGFVIPAQ